MSLNQRIKNRRNAERLAEIAYGKKMQSHTCENCGEGGGHWVGTRGSSIAALLTGQDDQEGFWICPKLYDANGRRAAAEIGRAE